MAKLIIIFFALLGCNREDSLIENLFKEVESQQKEFFQKNACNELADKSLLYFSKKIREQYLDTLLKKFPEISLTQRKNFFIIESYYEQSGQYYNYLIVKNSVYTYHHYIDDGDFNKISTDKFDNEVVKDVFKMREKWFEQKFNPEDRPVIGGGCFFVCYVIIDENKKIETEMLLQKEYSPFD